MLMAEMLASIVCLQKTQKAFMKPEDFQVQVKNYLGHKQLIIERKGFKDKEMDVSRCSTDILHFCLHNVHTCNRTMIEQNLWPWMAYKPLNQVKQFCMGTSITQVRCGERPSRGRPG